MVESFRVIARDALVAEELYEVLKAEKVKIVPAVPELFKHNPNPAQKFMRRVMLSCFEAWSA